MKNQLRLHHESETKEVSLPKNYEDLVLMILDKFDLDLVNDIKYYNSSGNEAFISSENEYVLAKDDYLTGSQSVLEFHINSINNEGFLDINRMESLGLNINSISNSNFEDLGQEVFNLNDLKLCEKCGGEIFDFKFLVSNLLYCKKCELEYFETVLNPHVVIKKLKGKKKIINSEIFKNSFEKIDFANVSLFSSLDVFTNTMNKINDNNAKFNLELSERENDINKDFKNVDNNQKYMLELSNGFMYLANDCIRENLNKNENIKKIEMQERGNIVCETAYIINVGNTIWSTDYKIEWVRKDSSKKYVINWGTTNLPEEVHPGESIWVGFYSPIGDHLKKSKYISYFQMKNTTTTFGDFIYVMFNLNSKYQYDFDFLKEKFSKQFKQFKSEYQLDNVSDYDILVSLENSAGDLDLALQYLFNNF